MDRMQWVAAMTALLLFACPLWAQNRLFNSDFKNGLKGWDIKGDSISLVPDGYPQADGAVAFSFNVPGDMNINQCIDLTDGYDFQIIAYARLAAQTNISLTASFYESSGCQTPLQSVPANFIPVEDQWFRYAVLMAVPVGSLSVRVEYRLDSPQGGISILDELFAGEYRDQPFDRDYPIAVREGDLVPGLADAEIMEIGSPDAREGVLSYGVTASDDERYVVVDNEIVWSSTDTPEFPVLRYDSISADAFGRALFSSSKLGGDILRTHTTTLLQDGDPAPGIPGSNILQLTFSSQVSSEAGSNFAFRAFITGNEEVLYTGTDLEGPVLSIRYREDSVAGGFSLQKSGIEKFRQSTNTQNLMAHLKAKTGSELDDDILVLNDVLLARESATSPEGLPWDAFYWFDVNNSGQFFATGTFNNHPFPQETYLWLGGDRFIRSGDTLAGVFIPPYSEFLNATLNNNGQLLFAVKNLLTTWWILIDDIENPWLTARLLLKSGDRIDFNNDGVPESAVFAGQEATYRSNMTLAPDGSATIAVNAGLSSFFDSALLLHIPPPCIPEASYYNDIPNWPTGNNILNFLPTPCDP